MPWFFLHVNYLNLKPLTLLWYPSYVIITVLERHGAFSTLNTLVSLLWYANYTVLL
jgi:hypothetical protein